MKIHRDFIVETNVKTIELINNIMQINIENIDELMQFNLDLSRKYLNDITKVTNSAASSQNSGDLVDSFSQLSKRSMNDYFSSVHDFCELIIHGQSKFHNVFEANIMCAEISIAEAMDNYSHS